MNDREETEMGLAFDPKVCESLQIHAPAAIQPHGALLAVRAEDFRITHASANLAEFLGLSAESALGQSVEAALGEAAGRALRAAFTPDERETADLQTIADPDGRGLRLRAFRTGRHVGVDIQPTQAEVTPRPPDGLMRAAMETFARATGSVELCALAVQGLKAITGYDRVMAYRYAADGHGEIIAEAREPHMEPYLGLHYPASDVPPQSRRLMVRQPVCLIADTNYSPTPLLAEAALDDGTPLDLTLSSLRSVSPIHREYLRNMGTRASLTVALTTQVRFESPTLWGMLVCHGEAPKIASPELQSVLAMIGQVVSMLLKSLGEAELYNQLNRRNALMKGLVDRIVLPPQSPMGLIGGEAELLKLVGATGALVHVSGAVFSFGRLPPLAGAERAMEMLKDEANGEVLGVDNLGIRHPELADCIAAGSGALLMPLPQPRESFILWFRPEQVRTVKWAGDPERYATWDPHDHRLSPRRSFAAWKEIQSGRSSPWTQGDMAIVRELRRSVEAAVAQRSSAALARLRHYDPLTGLPNRSLLQERLTGEEFRTGGLRSMLFLDLDGFKAVNDTLGHPAGDSLLIEIANRLVAAAGPHNLTVRLGGDEFVVLCQGLDMPSVTELSERIRTAIERPIEVAGRPCRVFASIGIAFEDQTGGLDLIRAADIAMYAAKQSGGNGAVLFEPSLHDRASRLFELESEMRAALSGGGDREFALLYQPVFKVAAGARKLAGFEALVRWRHPQQGWLSPAAFIALAEKTGLIRPLGDWVLKAALRQGRLFREAHPDANLTINVNVSVSQIPQEGFCLSIAHALMSADYPASALCLEVVESLLADSAAAAVLADIRKLGVKVAIDDFGMGYSSLSYLRRLPVDTVKLDRSFVEDIESASGGPDFVGAVISLAHSVGKPVVFEGIESEAQFNIACHAGADLVQGYFFAPPLSANAAMELVVRQRQFDEDRGDQPLAASI